MLIKLNIGRAKNSGEFDLEKVKTCSLYNKNLLLQKFNNMYTQQGRRNVF